MEEKALCIYKTSRNKLQMDTMYLFGYKSGNVMYTIINDAPQ